MRSGRSRKQNVSLKAKSRAAVKALPGEKEMEKYLSSTEVEIFQDPYRGLQSRRQSLATGTAITTPWNFCVWGTVTPEETEHVDKMAVAHVARCACPSMRAWSRKLQQENNKKRRKGPKKAKHSFPSEFVGSVFVVGTRPKGASYRCQCDYNPNCVATSGGIFDEIITERLRALEPVEVDTETTRMPLCENLKAQNADGLVRIPAASALGLPGGNIEGRDKDKNIMTILEVELKTKRNIVRLNPVRQNGCGVEGDPADVFAMPLPSLAEGMIQYSPATFSKLQSTRKSLSVDASVIEHYAWNSLKLLNNDKKAVLNVDKYTRIVDAWERELRFICPSMRSRVENNSISISVPPGIGNLGATCYLNTQLQCLAQNPVFLNGIFSWRAGSSTHKMNPVISKMQSLLAKLSVGGDCKLSTLDFSNALGLEHNEQQDPNEFARLLFERMEEAFQQCDHEGGLKNLLRRIFQGITTYETICMTCGQSSQRKEKFMDLNLPIVSNRKTRDKGKDMKINDYFGGKMGDTDVQHCLNEYFCAELLDGDNQYFCTKCGIKQDAKRVLKLTTLPPLLNVQLSRYVFDLTQFVKKKLSDKVLLPRTLIVPKHDGKEVCYKLCAVMRHQGTSAYAGHYVAEAMDWVTGQWFEFNDEVVKHLASGPSSSFDSQGRIEDTEVQISALGSKDAYNMYYVDEKFLAKSLFEEIKRRESRLASDFREDSKDIISKVSQERNVEYKILYDMCYADRLLADRLRRRELGIRKYMFPGSSSLTLVEEEHSMWVDADTLRQFLRLDQSLDERIRSGGHILRHKQLLCEHEKLHPVTSRKGKIIHRSTFNAYVALLKAEQSRVRQEAELRGDCRAVCDVPISLSENLICEQCSKSFRALLATKLRALKNIKELYNCLDPSLDKKDLQYYGEGEELDGSGHAFVYAVSKRMVTKYRNAVKQLVLTFSKLNDEGAASKPACGEDSLLEGLDCIDLSLFYPGSTSDLTETKERPTPELDEYFNSEIVCRHNNCNVLNDRRIVRLLTWDVWQRLKGVFPEAIELKRARVQVGENFEDDACELCQEEKAQIESTLSSLGRWAKEVTQDPNLKHLLQENDWNNFPNSSSRFFHLVHRKDLRNWRSVVEKLSNPRKLVSNSSHEMQEHVLLLVAPKHRKHIFDCRHGQDAIFRTSLIPLVCQERKNVIQDHIFHFPNSNAGKEETTRVLAPWVAVLSNEVYRPFVASFGKLLQMLQTSHKGEHGDKIECESIDDGEYLTAAGQYHPIIQSISKKETDGSQNDFTLVGNGRSKLFRVSPPLCELGLSTEKMFAFLSAEDTRDDESKGNIINHPSNCSKQSARADGTNPQDAIFVESDVECSTSPPQEFKARVFDLTDTGSVSEAIKCLESRSGCSPIEEEKGLLGFVRRSTRKKKSRYPLGCLVSETEVKVDKHLNVAALRLALFERSQVSITGRRILLAVFWKGKHQGHIEIRSEWIERQISEIVEDIQAQCEKKFSIECDHTLELHIYHQRDAAGSPGGLHESVMDALLQAANFANCDGTKNESSKKRKRLRSAERGFQGTLLHSRPAAVDINSDSSTDDQRVGNLQTGATCNSDGKVAAETIDGPSLPKKPHLYLPESDCDIREASPFSSKQSKSSKPAAGQTSSVCNRNGFLDDVVVIENVQEDLDLNARNPAVHESVVRHVLGILGESVDQSTCWDAVEWAMKRHPEETSEESLVEVVLNKVLQ